MYVFGLLSPFNNIIRWKKKKGEFSNEAKFFYSWSNYLLASVTLSDVLRTYGKRTKKKLKGDVNKFRIW